MLILMASSSEEVLRGLDDCSAPNGIVQSSFHGGDSLEQLSPSPSGGLIIKPLYNYGRVERLGGLSQLLIIGYFSLC